jgi:hypothetical protein
LEWLLALSGGFGVLFQGGGVASRGAAIREDLFWVLFFLLTGGLSLVATRVAVFGFWWLSHRKLRW